jgi:hypothetical protein
LRGDWRIDDEMENQAVQFSKLSAHFEMLAKDNRHKRANQQLLELCDDECSRLTNRITLPKEKIR